MSSRVWQEPFPVRHYEYGEVGLAAGGQPIEAVTGFEREGEGPRLAESPQHRGYLEAVEEGVREAWLVTEPSPVTTVLFL